jgi:quercetin dioxygenase-like cupin family protein
MDQPTTAHVPAILRPNDIPRHDRGGGAATTPLVTRKLGATGFINGITEFEPGAVIPFHSHNCEESVVLLEGDAVLDIRGETHPLTRLDTTWIPPNVVHRFRNMSKTSPMKILWIYASMDATRTLAETGETRSITAEHNGK